MDWKTLFFSAQGRIGAKDFWIAFAILVVSGLVIGQIKILSGLWFLASIYLGVCVGSKRLHDIGKSAWFVLVPLGIIFAAYGIGFIVGGAAFLSGLATGSDGAAVVGGIAGLGLAGLVVFIGMIASIGSVIWLGTRSGDSRENQFGPPRTVPLVTAV